MALGFQHILHGLKRHLSPASSEPATDGELLHRFVRQRDHGAFAELMTRHGPMVLGVCRRTLRDTDPGDAFQATFLVLMKKAGSVSWSGSIAAWLHQTALRICLKANVSASRRAAHEREAGTMRAQQAILTEAAWDDFADVLDEEIDRLPEKYRLPLVLCGLQGKSQDEAAQLLGWPVGSVKGRLSRARDMLRGRLSRRGIYVTSTALLSLLAEHGLANVSASLFDATFQGLLQNAAAGVSPSVHLLAQGAMKDMFISKLKKIAAAVLIACSLGATAGWAWWSTQADGENPRAELKLPPETPPKPDPMSLLEKLPEDAVTRHGRPHPGAYLRAQRVALSPDGRVLASAAATGAVVLTEVETGKEIGRLTWKPAGPFPGGEIFSLAFSPDGKRLAVGGMEPVSKRPRVEDPLGPIDLDVPLPFNAVPTRIRIFDLATSKQTLDLAGPRGGTTHIAFAEEFIAAGGNDPRVIVWDAKGRELHRLDATPPGALDGAAPFNVVRALSFSADGKSLLCRGSGAIRIWNPATGESVKNLVRPLEEELIAAEFSPDGKLLAGSGGMDDNILAARVTVWEADSGKEVCKLDVNGAHIMLLAFSADGKTLVTTGDDHRVRFWDSATGKETGKALSLAQDAAGLCWSKDGKTLAVAAGSVRLYDPKTGKDRWAGAGHSDVVHGVVWSPKGDWLASAGHDGLLCVWTPGASSPKTRLALGGAPIVGLSLTVDGKTLACGGGDGTVRLIDTAAWKVTSTLKEGKGLISAVSFSPDGKKLLAGGLDGKAHLWDVAAKKVVHTFEAKIEGIDPNENGIVINPQGRVAGIGPLGNHRAMTSALFSPDGDTVVTVHVQQIIHFWRAGTGKEARQVVVQGMAGAIAFSPGGGLLAIGEVAMGGPVPLAAGVDRGMMVRNAPLGGGGIGGGGIGGGGIIPIPGLGNIRPLRLWDMGREKEMLQLPWYEEDPGPTSVLAVAFSPDRRLVACGDDAGTIFIYELASGRFYRSYKGHQGSIHALAFSPDSRQLVSGSADASLLVWPVDFGPESKKGETLENLWRDLAALEADKAHAAAAALAHHPKGVEFLRTKLDPILPLTRDIERLLDDLGGKEFGKRKKAADDLEKILEFAEPHLRARLAKGAELEFQSRAAKLLERLVLPLENEESLRRLRIEALLRRLESPEARKLLAELGQK